MTKSDVNLALIQPLITVQKFESDLETGLNESIDRKNKN